LPFSLTIFHSPLLIIFDAADIDAAIFAIFISMPLTFSLFQPLIFDIDIRRHFRQRHIY
jgi:hypothetical protein